jgi:hypothetical protein
MRGAQILVLAFSNLALAGCGTTASPDATKPTAPPPPTLDGTISITVDDGIMLVATFPTAPLDQTRVDTTEGCSLSSANGDGPGSPATKSADAGDIIIDLVTDLGPETLTLSYDATSQSYGLERYARGVILHDDRIFVRTTGGTIPAFETSVVPPSTLQLSAPMEATVLTSTSDLRITWTPGEEEAIFGDVLVGGVDRISCRFRAGAGSAIIPAPLIGSALDDAHARGDACGDDPLGTCTSLGMIAYRTTETVSGEYRVRLRALTGMRRTLEMGK